MIWHATDYANSHATATENGTQQAPIKILLHVASASECNTQQPNTVAFWHWRVEFPERDPLEVYCNPDATHAAILERYPDALAAEPIPARTRRKPTEAEVAELRLLVQVIGQAERWAPDEIERAVYGALADPDGALVCYWALAVEHGLVLLLEDDRRTCS